MAGTLRCDVRAASSGAANVVGRSTAHVPPALRAVTAVAPLAKSAVPTRSGFTLVEILLAMAIFTMLMAALYSTWVLVMKASTVGKRTAAQLQRERIAMQTLENSLTFIQSHQASIDYYLFDVENGESPVLSFTAYLPDNFPRSGEFLLNAPR